MKHLSLFSGIGGFDLAAEWMGWENVAHCEINPFCREILKYYWPNAISYNDIKTTDFTIHRGRVDIVTGGFPCQPFSTAGKRKGTEDDRHLWPEMLGAIREISPRWVVGENVPGIVNWSDGMVFEQVQADLENKGYKIVAVSIPACGVGAAHRRDRTWIIAYSDHIGCQGITSQSLERAQRSSFQPMRTIEDLFRRWPVSQSRLYGRNDGLPFRLAGKTFSAARHRKESLMGYGNAIVPQVVYQIFKAIQSFETIPPNRTP